MKLSYVVGKLLFIDTPTGYSEGSIVEGKVRKKKSRLEFLGVRMKAQTVQI